tara:strand:+ start:88 stop:624 length:537 start_codon:yes stop_codon:yes gene_type:complete
MIDELKMNEKQIQIKRWLNRLDEVSVKMEATWGIGRLPKLVDPETQKRWDEQNERLRNAIENQNLNLIAELVEGTIRGWNFLEKAAIENGHEKNDAEYWEVSHGDFNYRIYKNNFDVRSSAPDGVVRYSLAEIAKILEDYQLVNKIKQSLGGEVAEVKQPKDWDKTKKYEIDDDEIPF